MDCDKISVDKQFGLFEILNQIHLLDEAIKRLARDCNLLFDNIITDENQFEERKEDTYYNCLNKGEF